MFGLRWVSIYLQKNTNRRSSLSLWRCFPLLIVQWGYGFCSRSHFTCKHLHSQYMHKHVSNPVKYFLLMLIFCLFLSNTDGAVHSVFKWSSSQFPNLSSRSSRIHRHKSSHQRADGQGIGSLGCPLLANYTWKGFFGGALLSFKKTSVLCSLMFLARTCALTSQLIVK